MGFDVSYLLLELVIVLNFFCTFVNEIVGIMVRIQLFSLFIFKVFFVLSLSFDIKKKILCNQLTRKHGMFIEYWYTYLLY